jgi:hypothetical protein
MAVDAEAGLRRGQGLAPSAHGGFAVLHPLVVHEGGEIIPDRRLELRLVVHEVEDRQVGLDAAGRRVEGLGRDAPGGRLAAQADRQERKSPWAGAGVAAARRVRARSVELRKRVMPPNVQGIWLIYGNRAGQFTRKADRPGP